MKLLYEPRIAEKSPDTSLDLGLEKEFEIWHKRQKMRMLDLKYLGKAKLNSEELIYANQCIRTIQDSDKEYVRQRAVHDLRLLTGSAHLRCQTRDYSQLTRF